MLYNILVFVISNFCKLVIRGINGLENVPKKGFIIASNHTSFFDPPIIGSIMAKKFGIKLHYLGKKELFETFFGKLFHNAVGTIPIDRPSGGKYALDTAIDYLKRGEVIGIFPEGTRSTDGGLQRGKTGAARLAIASRSPIVPAGIIGAYELWPRHKKLFKIKKIVKVTFGKPIYLGRYYKRKATKRALRKITDDIMKQIATLSKQKYKP